MNLLHRCLCLSGLLLLLACGNRQEKPAAAPVQKVMQDETGLSAQLKLLIDTTYDHPAACTADPDAFLQQVKKLPASAEDKTQYALVLINIGFCLKDDGQVLKSIRFFEKGLTYYQQEKPEDIDFYDYIAKPLGNLYTRTGDFEKAIALQQLAIAAAEAERRAALLPSLYSNLAITFQQINQYDSVLSNCRSGLAQSAARDAVTGLLYNTLTKYFLSQDNTDSAAYYNRQSVSIFQAKKYTGDTIFWYTTALELQSKLSTSANPTLAQSSIRQAINLTEQFFPGSKNREKAKLYEGYAGLLVQQEKWKEAQPVYRKVMELFAPGRQLFTFPDHTITAALYGLARCYARLGQPDTAADYYIKAIENDYLVQQLIVNRQSSYLNSKDNRIVLQEAMALLWKMYQQAAGNEREQLAIRILWITELSKGRQLLTEIDRTRQWTANGDTARQQAIVQLRYLYEEIAAAPDSVHREQLKAEAHDLSFRFQLTEKYFEKEFQAPDFANFSTYIQQQRAQQDIISWLIGGQDTYAIALNAKQSFVYKIQGDTLSQSTVPGFIRHYFQSGPAAYDNNPEQYRQQSAQLLLTLLPCAASLRSSDWLVSPDGILFALPLDAMVLDGAFLVQQKNMGYTYTLLLNEKNGSTEKYHADVKLFVKNTHERPLPDLPFALEEQKKIETTCTTTAFANNAATDSAFMMAMQSADIIHVATHAVAEEKQKPYLALAQKMTLDKLQYTTTRSPLVVLSACQTAYGQLVTAEGMESLNKAFLSKGVKGVIATQWSVSDASMPQLINHFYKELVKLHRPVKALANAKRDFLATASAAHRNPWYWASLTYTGAATELEVKAHTNHAIWWWIGLAVLILGGWIVYRVTTRR